MQKNQSKKKLMAGGNKKKGFLKKLFGKKKQNKASSTSIANSSNPNPVPEVDSEPSTPIGSCASINNCHSHVSENSSNHESKSVVVVEESCKEPSQNIESSPAPSPQIPPPSSPTIEGRSSPHQEGGYPSTPPNPNYPCQYESISSESPPPYKGYPYQGPNNFNIRYTTIEESLSQENPTSCSIQ